MSNPPEDEDRTVYQPKSTPATAPKRGAAAAPVPPPPAPPPAAPPPEAKPSGQQMTEGEVLNGIYRITRFIARGGMGEVYEAVNVHQPDERVAVKVMLQHLAQDELVAAMFAKEAATLTRLHHEAIVPYRLAARDSQGRPYIVTEFIPGTSLEQRLGELKLSDTEFVAIAQKLAAGLGTAHTLGAIHRDIAPDNILLAHDDPARPKIIDFGIAKDAREHSATIVGDGFAGKLRYVAPEQLGEYGRNVGPWTDIYSLALTLRAVLAGKHSDMGGSLSDAVRKRMVVPDLSDIPVTFRPAFEAALQPDPGRRPQSMAAFNLMLTGGAELTNFQGGMESGGFSEVTKIAPKLPQASAQAAGVGLVDRLTGMLPAGLGENRVPLLIGGGVLGLLTLVGIVITVSLASRDVPEAPQVAEGEAQQGAPAGPTTIAPGTPEFAALAQQIANTVPCSWLTFAGAEGGTVRFNGGAAVPGEAQARLASALEAGGAQVPPLDFGNVVRFPEKDCAVIDALREVRGPSLTISTPQQNYEVREEPMETVSEPTAARPHAKVLLQVESASPLQEVALLAVHDAAGIGMWKPNRAKIDTIINELKGTKTGNGFSFSQPFELTDGRPEGDGIIVVSSPSPLPADLSNFDAGWPERFRAGAKAGGWKVDAVWFRIEDRQPG